MKSTTSINVIHTLADGSKIDDISKAVIPSDHPIYDFLASVIKRRLQSQETKKGA